MEDGETLWSIARRYETTVDAVREANEMDSETIRPGQTLRIPRASSSGATASSTRTESATRTPGERSASTERASSSSSERSGSANRPSSASSGERSGSANRASSSSSASTSRPAGAARAREHTVGDGETLWGIARRYETTVDSLRRANDLDEDEQIRPGQKLAIPQN